MSLKGFKKRFYLSFFNVLPLFKFYKWKLHLFNKIPGCKAGKGTRFAGKISSLCKEFVVGENCWIGKNLSLEGNGKVTLGNNVDIAPSVTFLTGSHLIGGSDRRAGEGITLSVEVGDACWIGSNSLILGKPDALKIENGVVIGCGSVIIKQCEKNCLYAGNPGKLIKQLPE